MVQLYTVRNKPDPNNGGVTIDSQWATISNLKGDYTKGSGDWATNSTQELNAPRSRSITFYFTVIPYHNGAKPYVKTVGGTYYADVSLVVQAPP